jgi:Mg-chelatase subunit ChlD
MSFLNPLGLSLLALVPIVIFFHLFRARRREIRVSTWRFWDSKRREQSRTTFFAPKLRLNPLLILQLLAVILLSFAIAQTTLTHVAQGWPRTILVIDTSASMAADDVPGGRLGSAQGQAEGLVARLKPDQQVMIVEAAAHPSIREPFTTDKSELQHAIADLRPTGEIGKIDEAIRLATELLADGPPGEIHVFTDAAYGHLSQLKTKTAPVSWHVVGDTGDNVAITTLEVRAESQSLGVYESFITLDNFSSSSQHFTLKLAIDNNVIHEEKVDLPAKLRRSFMVPFRYQNGRGLLSAQIDPHDHFSLDDIAYAVIPAWRRIKVVLASRGNVLLEKALRSDPRIDLQLTSPEQFPTSLAGAEIVVLDRVPPSPIPLGNYLLIQSLPSNVPIQQFGTIELPEVVNWDTDHPVMQHIDFSNVLVKSALEVQPVGDCDRLVESDRTPLVVTCLAQGMRAIFVGFDVLQSDLPIRAAFPLFVSNAIKWLAPVRLEDGPLHIRGGEPISVDVNRGFSVARITKPDGKIDVLPIEYGHLTYSDTRLTGIYWVSVGNTQQRVAVDLLDEGESDLTPGRAVQVGAAIEGAVPSYAIRNDLWPILAALALAVLSAEAGLFLYWYRQSATYALVLRGTALSLVVIALIEPAVSIPSKASSVAFLVDVSDSIPLEQKRRAFVTVERAIRQQGQHDTVKLITFGRESGLSATLDLKSTDGIELLARSRDGSATDIGDAIRLGLAILPREGSRKLILLSDGRENRGSAVEVAWEAKRQHVPIFPFAIGGPPAGEVLIDKITLPVSVRVGETFSVRVNMWSDRATEGQLSLSKDGVVIISAQVALKSGNNHFVYKDVAERDGFHVYSAEIHSHGDKIEENNQAFGAITVRGEPHVLFVDSEPDRSMELVEALDKQHFVVSLIKPEDLEGVVKNISSYDTVILSNTPAASLSDEEMAKMEAYVTDEGGGLIMLGGEKSFGAGGYGGTPVEAVLPVEMAPRAKINVPSQAMVMVLDRSGSMSTKQGQFSRIDLAKNGAQLAVGLLSENAQVGVLAFDTEAEWVVPLQSAKNKQDIVEKVSTIETGGGGTELLSALEEAYRVLKNQEAMLKHIVVLSDGEAPLKGFKELLRALVDDKITVSSIAISSEAGQDLLKKISDWGGGRYYFTNDMYEIPRIFTDETRIASGDYLVEETFRPVPKRKFHEILKAFELNKLPSLHGYVATTAKPFAEVLLESDRQDPILAVWRNGVGRTLAFTSDVKGRWGQEFLSWNDFNKFFGELVRWTTRNRDTVPKISFVEDQGQLSLEMSDDKGNYVNFLQGQMGVVYPDKSRVVLPVLQSGPGRYSATFRAEREGVYVAGVSLMTSDGGLVDSVVGTGIVPKAAEYRDLAVNGPLLKRLADISGGDLLRDPADVFHVKAISYTSVTIWLWLLLLSAALMTIDLMVRWLQANADGLGSRPRWEGGA